VSHVPLCRRFVAALLLVVTATVSASAQSLPVPSYWTNQRGSEMKLYNIDPQGNFDGVYINHAVGYSCQNMPYALVGHASGANVAFAVVWNNGVQNCNSKTVWHGRVTGKTIVTTWVLSTYPGGAPIGKGSDTFQEQ
jgi:hypothetical protein